MPKKSIRHHISLKKESKTSRKADTANNLRQSTNDSRQTMELPPVPWNGWLGALFVIAVFFAAQVAGGVLFGIYSGLRHWSADQAAAYLSNSITGQFLFYVGVYGLSLLGVYLFIRRYKFDFKQLGLGRVRPKDLGYALAAVPAYYFLAWLILVVSSIFAPGLKAINSQAVGFSGAHSSPQLVMAFLGLAVFPPVAEEIMTRGFLYSSLKKVLSPLMAAVSTSVLFAVAHLGEGTAGLLWTAAIQFFVLSLVLVYLREKTQSLWASIFLHGINNTVAFVSIFLIH